MLLFVCYFGRDGWAAAIYICYWSEAVLLVRRSLWWQVYSPIVVFLLSRVFSLFSSLSKSFLCLEYCLCSKHLLSLLAIFTTFKIITGVQSKSNGNDCDFLFCGKVKAINASWLFFHEFCERKCVKNLKIETANISPTILRREQMKAQAKFNVNFCVWKVDFVMWGTSVNAWK